MKKRGIYKTKFSEKQGLCGPLLMCLKKRSFVKTEVDPIDQTKEGRI